MAFKSCVIADSVKELKQNSSFLTIQACMQKPGKCQACCCKCIVPVTLGSCPVSLGSEALKCMSS